MAQIYWEYLVFAYRANPTLTLPLLRGGNKNELSLRYRGIKADKNVKLQIQNVPNLFSFLDARKEHPNRQRPHIHRQLKTVDVLGVHLSETKGGRIQPNYC